MLSDYDKIKRDIWTGIIFAYILALFGIFGWKVFKQTWLWTFVIFIGSILGIIIGRHI